MDSPLPVDEAVRFAGTGERGRDAARRLFGAADEAPERLRLVEPMKLRRFPQRQRTRSALVPAALLGAASLAVLVYGSTTRNRGHGGASVTTRIPDAAGAGAAVRNLPPPDLLKPVSPEEAVKENSDRPFVNRTDTPASRFVLKTAADDRERALTCLTQAVYYEAASEGADGGRAVAQVVLNRLRHPGYPASVCGVVYQGADRPTGCQFTFTCDGSLLRPHVESLWTRSRKIAEAALSGSVFAPIGHATHYHADYVLPYWADSLDKTVQIGRHIFYRLRGSVGDRRSFFQRYAGFEPPLPDPRPAIAAVPLGTSAEEQQLAKALIGEDSKGTVHDAEKATLAATPLLSDSVRSTLIADEQVPQITSHPSKSVATCPRDNERKQLAPLAPTDMRAGASSLTC
jgi:spore germination cell wall hydrolase CwlJ-like protein